jgi:hypothetical protein
LNLLSLQHSLGAAPWLQPDQIVAAIYRKDVMKLNTWHGTAGWREWTSAAARMDMDMPAPSFVRAALAPSFEFSASRHVVVVRALFFVASRSQGSQEAATACRAGRNLQGGKQMQCNLIGHKITGQ